MQLVEHALLTVLDNFRSPQAPVLSFWLYTWLHVFSLVLWYVPVSTCENGVRIVSFIGGSGLVCVTCIYLGILLFNTISLSDDALVYMTVARQVQWSPGQSCSPLVVSGFPPLYVFLSVFIWLLHGLSFFELQHLITPLASYNYFFITDKSDNQWIFFIIDVELEVAINGNVRQEIDQHTVIGSVELLFFLLLFHWHVKCFHITCLIWSTT